MNNDLISRSEAEKLGATCLAKRNENGQLEAIISLDNAPTVERPTGKWIGLNRDGRGYYDGFECSECGAIINNGISKTLDYPSCPYCLANME